MLFIFLIRINLKDAIDWALKAIFEAVLLVDALIILR